MTTKRTTVRMRNNFNSKGNEPLANLAFAFPFLQMCANVCTILQSFTLTSPSPSLSIHQWVKLAFSMKTILTENKCGGSPYPTLND